MPDLEIKSQLGQDDVAEVTALLDRARAADGHRPIDEHRWVDAAHGGRAEFAGLLLREGGHDHPIGYAQVTRGAQSWAVDMVIDPHHRYDALAVAPRLLGGCVDIIRAAGGGHVHHWVYEPTDAHESIAQAAGFTRGRDLYQMRRSLPVGAKPSLPTRSFDPERDVEAWLEVNNRAFARHPEQGGWRRADVEDRMREEWFDADGFLVHEREGRMAGFCWTKVHQDTDPPMGEIYVIAVDPDFAGRGIGRELVLAGLDHLHQRGLSVGMLYVDADNDAAVGLYRDLGFTVDHIDRAFVADIAPADGPDE